MTTSSDTAHPVDLRLYHRNPRIGNVAAIEGSLAANGQYKPIVVNVGTHTGRPNEVLAGNHTLMAIRNLAERHPDDPRWQQVLVHRLDVDDDRAARIVLADNRTSEVGGMDTEALVGLLQALDEDFDGTAYDADDFAHLYAQVTGDAQDAIDDLFPEHDDDLGDPDEGSTAKGQPITCPACQHQWSPADHLPTSPEQAGDR